MTLLFMIATAAYLHLAPGFTAPSHSGPAALYKQETTVTLATSHFQDLITHAGAGQNATQIIVFERLVDPGIVIQVAEKGRGPGFGDQSIGSAPQRTARQETLAVCASLIARLTIRAARDEVSAEPLDSILSQATRSFPNDHVITEAVAELSGLSSHAFLSHSALREQLRLLAPEALRDVDANTSSIWKKIASAKDQLLIALGYASPMEPTVSEIALRNAQSLLDRRQLNSALFELTASAPEVQKRLSVWISEARLRIRYDTAIDQLLQQVIRQCNQIAY
jgi:hypothetical protein